MQDDTEQFEDDEWLGPSRGQLKREQQEIESFGRELVNLSSANFAKFLVSEQLVSAVEEARRLNRSALNRQLRYIRRLLNEEDIDGIRQKLAEIKAMSEKDNVFFHRLESWRDALVSGDMSVIDTIAEQYPNLDRQHIRQLSRNAQKDLKLNKPPKNQRIIFQYLKSLSD